MEEIKDLLLQFLHEYNAEEPGVYGDSRDFILVYTTSQPLELYFSILHSAPLRERIHALGMEIAYLNFTDTLVIIECATCKAA